MLVRRVRPPPPAPRVKSRSHKGFWIFLLYSGFSRVKIYSFRVRLSRISAIIFKIISHENSHEKRPGICPTSFFMLCAFSAFGLLPRTPSVRRSASPESYLPAHRQARRLTSPHTRRETRFPALLPSNTPKRALASHPAQIRSPCAPGGRTAPLDVQRLSRSFLHA